MITLAKREHLAKPTKRLSLRARIIRFGLRTFLKRRFQGDFNVEDARRHMQFLTLLVPRPPRYTTTVAVDAAGIKAQMISTPQSRPDRHILYLHGGGFTAGSPSLYRGLTWRLAKVCRANVLCIDYRLAPEHPFPAALDDSMAAYRWLIGRGDPRRMAVMGDSAGGGLAFAMLLRLRDEGIALPSAAVVLSPWTDLALTGDSFRYNAQIDPLISVDLAPRAAGLYLAGGEICAPYASPLYGDLTGLPPTLILVGSDEVLLDDSVRMAKKMVAAGSYAEIEVWPQMWHAWPMLAGVMPEAAAALARIGVFVQRHL
jgi:epsilon-lactone hydrolase